MIAPSFADIFYNNCFKNGMLPIRLDEATVDELFAACRRASGLPADGRSGALHDHATTSGCRCGFEVDAFRRHCLLNGLDDIGLTLQHDDKIAAYEAAHGIV